MAWWGVAMSVWYPLWYPPSEASLRTGASAVEKARALGAATDRERDYIAAIGAFYQDMGDRMSDIVDSVRGLFGRGGAPA